MQAALALLEGTSGIGVLADAVAQRVLASLRAAEQVLPAQPNTTASVNIITVGSLSIDEDRHEVFVDGKLIDSVKPQEFRFLRLLALNAGRVLKRPQILELAWPEDAYLTVDERVVDVIVSRLRKRLGNGVKIRCVPRMGYKLVDR